MKIKDVQKEDLKKIYKLEKKIFKENAFSNDIIQKLMKHSIIFLKLEKTFIKRNLIGFIIVIKDRTNYVNIANFLINSKYQNKGYGSFLLTKTIEKIKKLRSITNIVLNVKIDNKIAINLYKKHEFKVEERIDNYYTNGGSSFLMKKML